MAMPIRKLIRLIEADGWKVSVTGGGHLACRHPDASGTVYAAASASDHRALENLKHNMRRALRAGRTTVGKI